MGREIIKSQASARVSEYTTKINSVMQPESINCDEHEGHGIQLLKSKTSLEYLCNLKPHRFEGIYVNYLPEITTGEDFLKTYGELQPRQMSNCQLLGNSCISAIISTVHVDWDQTGLIGW